MRDFVKYIDQCDSIFNLVRKYKNLFKFCFPYIFEGLFGWGWEYGCRWEWMCGGDWVCGCPSIRSV